MPTGCEPQSAGLWLKERSVIPLPDHTLWALILFSFVSSFTPGPNNMMLLASGVNFGWRRTVPHMLGVGLGFTFMVLLIGLGLGKVFTLWPLLYTILKVVGATYLLWLAWKIAQSGPVGEGGGVVGRPMTFLGACAFQWVNPKAWMMAVTAVAAYPVSPDPLWNAAVVAVVFGVVNLPCVSSWVMFGVGLRQLLNDPVRVRIFNGVMALLLVASLWPMFAELRT